MAQDLPKASEICAAILSRKMRDDVQYQSLPKELAVVFKDRKFPVSAAGKIKRLKKTPVEEISVNTLCQTIKFEIKFDEKLLAVAKRGLDVCPDYCALIILYYFIAFVEKVQISGDISHYKVMLEALQELVRCSECKDQKLAVLAVSAFVHAYSAVANAPTLSLDSVEDWTGLFTAMTGFLTSNPELPEVAYNVVLLTLDRVIDPRNVELSKIGHAFLNFLSIITSVAKMPAFASAGIVHAIRPLIFAMDAETLRFLKRSISRLDKQEVMPIVLALPAGVGSLVDKKEGDKQFEYVGVESKNPVLPDGPAPVRHEFREQSTFSDVLRSFPPIPEFPKEGILLDPKLAAEIDVAGEVMAAIPDAKTQLLDDISRLIKDTQTSRRAFENVSVFLRLLSNLGSFDWKYIEQLLEIPMLTSDESLFAQGKNFPFINEVRQLATVVLIHQEPKEFGMVCQRLRRMPLLFAEFVMRVAPPQIQLKDWNENICEHIISILRSFYYYQNFCNVDSETRASVNTARLSVLKMIDVFTNDKNLTQKLFHMKDFLDCLLPIGFESNVRMMMFSLTKKYMKVRDEDDCNYHLRNWFRDVFITVLSGDPAESLLHFVYDGLKWMEDVIPYCDRIVEELGDVTPPLCRMLAKLKPSPLAEQVVLETISVFSSSFDAHSLTRSDMQCIETGVKNVFGSEFGTEMQLKLASLCSGARVEEIGEVFVIRQPRALRLFLSLFLNSKHFIGVADWFIKLCQFSPMNAAMCHKAQLDLDILSILYQARTDQQITVNQVQVLFNLFFEIAKYASSLAVVSNFVSLFSTHAGRHLSPHCLTAIECLERLMKCAMVAPSTSFYDMQVIAPGIRNDVFDSSFTLSFWLMPVEITSELVNLISFSGSTGGFEVLFKQDMLLLKSDQEIREVPVTFVQGKWRSVIVSVHVADKLNCTVTIDGGLKEEVLVLSKPNVGTDLKFIVNGADNVWLGPVGLFPYIQPADAVQLADYGYHKLIHLSNPHIYLSPVWSNGALTASVAGMSKHLQISHSGKAAKPCTPFVFLLNERNGLSILLPLFAQLDMTFENDTQIPQFIDHLVWIFKESLMRSATSQILFVDESGFGIISQLLVQSSDKHIDYNLYLSLYELLNGLAYEKAKVQLLNELLLNIELWMKADGKSHENILTHWAENLVPCFLPLVLKGGKTITTFVSMLRVYYFYEPVDKEIRCVDSRARTDMDVYVCREAIMMVCKLIAHESGLKDSDIEIIVSHICTYSDNKQLDDLLTLINDLVHDDVAMEKSPNKLNSFHFLYFILVDPKLNEFLTQKTLEIILYLISKDRSDLGKDADVAVLAWMVTREFFTETNRDLVCAYFCEGDAAFYPLVVMMATNMSAENVGPLLKQMPCELVCKNGASLFWTVMAFSFVQEDIREHVIDFLSACPYEYWCKIYVTIGIVSRLLGRDATRGKEMRHSFLVKIANSIDSPEKFDIFAKLCQQFMFLRSMLEKNDHLESVHRKFEEGMRPATKRAPASRVPPLPTAKSRGMRDSKGKVPMVVPNKPQPPSPRTAQRRESWSNHRLSIGQSQSAGQCLAGLCVIASELFPQLQHSEGPNVQLGIRLVAESGEWMDSDIGLLVLEKYTKFPDKKWDGLLILIMACMLSNKSVQPPKDLKLGDLESFPDVSPLAFYNKQAKRFNKKPLFASELTEGEIQLNSFLYLETLCIELINNDIMTLGKEVFMQTCGMASSFKEQLASRLETEITALAGSTIKDFLNDEVSVRHFHGLRMWSRKWKQLTIEGAPWYRSLILTQPQKKYYKRDFVACFRYASSKVRRNFEYNDHLKESLARNTGSIITAQEQYEKKKAEIAKKYEANAPLPIFDTIDYRDDSDFLSTQEVLFEGKCEVITAKRTVPATLFISVSSIFIENSTSKFGKIISTKNIRHIFMRTHLHRPTAIEIFEFNGNSYFINFPELSSEAVLEAFKDKRIIWSKVKYVPERARWTVQTKGFKEFFAQQPFTKQWCNREISNFEYLMILNIYSGRSFRNIFQYPFFPWILTKYDQPTLDLTDESIFRDLSKPIGALNPNKLQDAVNTYNQYLEGGMPAFMYSSAPVSPLAIYFWLVRMEPFTTLHTEMQSGKFDHTARLFLSIPNAWNLVYRQAGDFRELVPEFFFMSEFLLNHNDFDLGDVDGVKAGDVALPAWAKTAMEFIYLHRKALESEYVSNHINQWIDLVWGEKQLGQKAIDAHNVFKPQLYSNIWETEEGKDPMNVVEIETTLSYIGQIPPQLFEKAHPVRKPKEVPLYHTDEFSMELPVSSNIIKVSFEDTGRALLLRGVLENNEIMLIDITFAKKKKKKPFANLAKKSDSHSRSVPVVNNPTVHAQCKTIPNIEMLYSHTQERKPLYEFVNSRALCVTSNMAHGGLFLVGVEDGEITELREQRLAVTALAADGCIIATANIDATIVVFEMDEMKCDIPSFKSHIKALAVSDTFHMLACVSNDGELMFGSLTTNSFVRKVSLGYRAKKLLITPAWGFTVVQFKKIENGNVVFYIASYSANGEQLAMSKVPNKIVCWHAWKSRCGFDYVVAADKTNSVYCFEAFYCKPSRKLFPTDKMKTRAKIVGLYYLVAQGAVVILCENGEIFFVPCNCEDIT